MAALTRFCIHGRASGSHSGIAAFNSACLSIQWPFLRASICDPERSRLQTPNWCSRAFNTIRTISVSSGSPSISAGHRPFQCLYLLSPSLSRSSTDRTNSNPRDSSIGCIETRSSTSVQMYPSLGRVIWSCNRVFAGRSVRRRTRRWSPSTEHVQSNMSQTARRETGCRLTRFAISIAERGIG